MTKVESAHLRKCKADHYRTTPFLASDVNFKQKRLLVCSKTGQYVDHDALAEEMTKVGARNL